MNRGDVNRAAEGKIEYLPRRDSPFATAGCLNDLQLLARFLDRVTLVAHLKAPLPRFPLSRGQESFIVSMEKADETQ